MPPVVVFSPLTKPAVSFGNSLPYGHSEIPILQSYGSAFSNWGSGFSRRGEAKRHENQAEAFKCLTLDMTHFTSDHISLVKAGNMAPPVNH